MKVDNTGMFVLKNDDIIKLLDSLPRCIYDTVVARVVTDKTGCIIQILIEYDSYHKEVNHA